MPAILAYFGPSMMTPKPLPHSKLASFLIIAYFVALIVGFYSIDWQVIPFLLWLVIFYGALFTADFISGLVHLYIDYQPLNRKRGYDKLFFYAGDRGSEDFRQLKQRVAAHSSFLDKEVYHFKVHHRAVSPYLQKPYRFFFYETIVPAALVLIAALVCAFNLEPGIFRSYITFSLLINSLGILHTNHIHAWVHGSKTMPWGTLLVKPIQKLRLMYSVETHNRHHKDGESGFCFIVGHANFIVDYICRVLLQKGLIQKKNWFGEA